MGGPSTSPPKAQELASQQTSAHAPAFVAHGAWRAERTCLMCPAVFVPNTSRQKMCSPTCRRARQRQSTDQWYRNHPEAKRAHIQKYNAKRVRADFNEWQRKARARRWTESPEQMQQANAKRTLKRFGLSVEAFEAMLAAQGGRCAICGGTGSSINHGRRLSVDHCHGTGKVRGLLCHGCNVGLGHFRDDPGRLLAAAAYLADPLLADDQSKGP